VLVVVICPWLRKYRAENNCCQYIPRDSDGKEHPLSEELLDTDVDIEGKSPDEKHEYYRTDDKDGVSRWHQRRADGMYTGTGKKRSGKYASKCAIEKAGLKWETNSPRGNNMDRSDSDEDY
jgi:hypothetical protein